MAIVPPNVYMKEPVFTEIARRLERVGIKQIDRFIMTMTNVGKSTLDGIQFVPQNLDGTLGTTDFISDVDASRALNGKRAFAGGPADKNNINLILSLLATKGTGYREVFYLADSPRIETSSTRTDWAFASKFGGLSFVNKPHDTSSLHLDIGSTTCNIHIDRAGFVFAGPDGIIYLSADAVQHTADELLLKDKSYRIPVIGTIARFVNLSLQLRVGNSSLAESAGSTGFVYRPHSAKRDTIGTLSIEKSLNFSDDLRFIGRGSLGYNHDGNQEFSWAVTGVLELTFGESNLYRKR